MYDKKHISFVSINYAIKLYAKSLQVKHKNRLYNVLFEKGALLKTEELE